MKDVFTKERKELIKQGGEAAIALVSMMLAENRYMVSKDYTDIITENEKKAIRMKQEVRQAKNGKEKILTVTQVVQELGIEGLTTTILNKWLVSRNLGAYIRFNNEKKKTFQPNENFMVYIAKEGYSLTGHTVAQNKIKVTYSYDMISRINSLYRNEIIDFVLNY